MSGLASPACIHPDASNTLPASVPPRSINMDTERQDMDIHALFFRELAPMICPSELQTEILIPPVRLSGPPLSASKNPISLESQNGPEESNEPQKFPSGRGDFLTTTKKQPQNRAAESGSTGTARKQHGRISQATPAPEQCAFGQSKNGVGTAREGAGTVWAGKLGREQGRIAAAAKSVAKNRKTGNRRRRRKVSRD
ncbi:unnamed protein product [Fraxinus pennsylvanica]|uniref:Uncharacterized protein n=1 Tax=Fraxinus pennsylvanica TaxID=56036 RepID=A0AAD1ZMS8_9LAMI|nr:unnamed protein product [Fraxinus pennsylvanica]